MNVPEGVTQPSSGQPLAVPLGGRGPCSPQDALLARAPGARLTGLGGLAAALEALAGPAGVTGARETPSRGSLAVPSDTPPGAGGPRPRSAPAGPDAHGLPCTSLGPYRVLD